MNPSTYFSTHYSQARDSFQLAAQKLNAGLQSHLLPNYIGAQGETLTMDVVRLGSSDAQAVLLVTSGVHGAEGLCGSGLQIALMHDQDLLDRLRNRGIALLVVHAVNPYGFSHLRRVNEDNIDLNRNFLDFSQPLPSNVAYAQLHAHLIPAEWPPADADQAALAAYSDHHGPRAYQNAVTTGQSAFSNGVFYSGTAPSWSNRTLRQVLREHASGAQRLAWIDLHTGLGPAGHGEKIYAGRDDAAEWDRARAWWGSDLFSPHQGTSQSEPVRGSAASCLYEECPNSVNTAMALEFGTVPLPSMLQAVYGDQWLANHPDASPNQASTIKQTVRDAFYIDSDTWRGSVLGQTRVAVLQACIGLAVE